MRNGQKEGPIVSRHISRAWVLLVLALICFGAGCASYMQAYTGEPRTDGQVALLRGTTHGEGAGFGESNNWNGSSLVSGSGRLSVARIDGQEVGKVSWIELLPGRHVVEWSYVDAAPGFQRKAAGKCSFEAEAGGIYSLFYGKVMASAKVLVSVADIAGTAYAKDGREAMAKHFEDYKEQQQEATPEP